MRLDDQITEHFRLAKTQQSALKRLQIETIKDLLLYFPARYESVVDVRSISELSKDGSAVIYGKLIKLKAKKTWKIYDESDLELIKASISGLEQKDFLEDLKNSIYPFPAPLLHFS